MHFVVHDAKVRQDEDLLHIMPSISSDPARVCLCNVSCFPNAWTTLHLHASGQGAVRIQPSCLERKWEAPPQFLTLHSTLTYYSVQFATLPEMTVLDVWLQMTESVVVSLSSVKCVAQNPLALCAISLLPFAHQNMCVQIFHQPHRRGNVLATLQAKWYFTYLFQCAISLIWEEPRMNQLHKAIAFHKSDVLAVRQRLPLLVWFGDTELPGWPSGPEAAQVFLPGNEARMWQKERRDIFLSCPWHQIDSLTQPSSSKILSSDYDPGPEPLCKLQTFAGMNQWLQNVAGVVAVIFANTQRSDLIQLTEQALLKQTWKVRVLLVQHNDDYLHVLRSCPEKYVVMVEAGCLPTRDCVESLVLRWQQEPSVEVGTLAVNEWVTRIDPALLLDLKDSPWDEGAARLCARQHTACKVCHVSEHCTLLGSPVTLVMQILREQQQHHERWNSIVQVGRAMHGAKLPHVRLNSILAFVLA